MKIASIAAAISLLTMQAVQAADIRVFCTGAARSAYEELAPQFEKATGHKLITTFGLPSELVKKLDAGEPVDAIILSYDVDRLIKQGKIVAGSRVVLGRTGVGVAVPAGAPKPAYNNADALKRSLLGAKFIATSGEGSSGQLCRSRCSIASASATRSSRRSSPARPVRRRSCWPPRKSTSR